MIPWLSSLSLNALRITAALFKIMIPIIVVVKVIEMLGGIGAVGRLLGPMMEWLGLPASMGLVWATTMITNVYGGMIMFITVAPNESLTVAEVTIISTMMMLAHSLPVETSIARKAGMPAWFSLLIRIGSSVLIAFVLSRIYQHFSWLQSPSTLNWIPEARDNSLLAWLLNQLKLLVGIAIIIWVLVIVLDILRRSGVERVFIVLLSPILHLLGLGSRVASMSVVGMTLGLTYGGGLLIDEARKGDLRPREVFGALALLSLCHGLIEDTLLVLMLGADISGVLYARLIYSGLFMAISLFFVRRLSDKQFHRYLYKAP